jgi:serine/threonine-protein kinase
MTMPTRLSDRYELGEILGFGGMSEVHLARDLRLNRDVAVKVLRADLARDPTFYLRFRREAQHAAALNHPNIVAVHDTGEADTALGRLPYIVMEYVDGSTLREIVRESGPMDPVRAIGVIADACEALNFSHQHGIVHRDVKPANIMISKTGVVKVMDFGIAKALADVGTPITQTAAVIGTAQYFSPEQASGEPVDARSDVYSLGCVLYELLTGEPLFAGDSAVAVAYQHVRKDPMPPSQRHDGISPELDAVVLKALTKNPDKRYQSASDLRVDLLRVEAGRKPSAPKPSPGGSEPNGWAADEGGAATAPRRPRPPRWLMIVAGLMVVGVVLAVAVNTFGFRGDVRVPDLRGQPQQDAVAALQNLGFKIRGPVATADPSLVAGEVVSTDPAAGTTLAGGDEITVNVSSGPEQQNVPACTNVTVSDCTRRLADAGFVRSTQSPTASATVAKDRVIGTIPVAGQSSAVTNEITIQVSTGPGTQRVPDVAGQTVQEATTSLNIAGFPVVLTGPVDSTLPVGRVASTDPPAGTDLSVESAVTLKVSLGNQIQMPNLIGRTYDEVVRLLQVLGHVGPLLNAGDQPGSGDDRGRVVKQDPPTGGGINRDGTITLTYGS